jgi:acylphosphatase
MRDERGLCAARRYLITGRVQGVGFRQFTLQCAAREGVRGWVRNTPEGGVEIEATGFADALARFETAIRVGPLGSRIDRFGALELTTAPPFDGFHVRV